MQTGHPDTATSSSARRRVREFTAMLEVELAGDHIDLPSFPEVALRVRRALADDDVSIDQWCAWSAPSLRWRCDCCSSPIRRR